MVDLKYFDGGQVVFAYRYNYTGVPGGLEYIVALTTGSVKHKSYDNSYLDENPGELDPWPKLVKGGFHFNPLIHYQLDGELNCFANQTSVTGSILTGDNILPLVLAGYKKQQNCIVTVQRDNIIATSACMITNWNGTSIPTQAARREVRSFKYEDGVFYSGRSYVDFLLDGPNTADNMYAAIESLWPIVKATTTNRKSAIGMVTPRDPNLWLDRFFASPPVISLEYWTRLRVREVTSAPWSQIAMEAYDSLELGTESNGIMYAVEYTQMYEQVHKLLNIYKLGSASKALASVYLSYIYGWKLTLQDTLDMIDALLEDPKYKKYRLTWSVKTVGNSTFRYAVYTDTNKLISLLQDLANKLDACLTLENVWDMIPYSFVIDWLLPIGDALNAIDKYLYLQREYNCFSCRTWNYEAPLVYNRHGFSGTLYLLGYQRRYYKDLLQPSFSPNLENPLTHLVEGSALILANTNGSPRQPLKL